MQSKKTKVGIDELRDEKEKERSWKNDPFPVCFSAPRLRRLITHTKTNDIQNATKRVAEDRWFFFTIVWGGGSDYIDSDSYKMPGSIAHDVAGKYI